MTTNSSPTNLIAQIICQTLPVLSQDIKTLYNLTGKCGTWPGGIYHKSIRPASICNDAMVIILIKANV